jgi:hypothetical protein
MSFWSLFDLLVKASKSWTKAQDKEEGTERIQAFFLLIAKIAMTWRFSRQSSKKMPIRGIAKYVSPSTQIHNNQSVGVGWCGLGVQRHHRSVVLTMMGSGENIDWSVDAPIRLLLLPNTHPNAPPLGQHT